MAVTLTPLVTEVQTRCDALTNSSTVSEVIEAAIAAKKVAMADGAVNRTVLDAQIQRVVNASGSGSLIEDLIALAASVEQKPEGSGGGVDGGIDIGQVVIFTFDEPIVQLGSRVFVREGFTTDLENAAPDYKGAIISGFSDWFLSDVEELGTNTQLNAAYSANGTTIVVGASGSVYRSTDGGVAFYKMSGPWTTSNFQAVVSNGQGKWFIYHTAQNSYISNDDGITWELAPELPGGIHPKTLQCAGDNLIAALFSPGTGRPLIRSDDFGLTWSQSNIVLPDQTITNISADPGSGVLLVAYANSSTTAGNWNVSHATGNWHTGAGMLGMAIGTSTYPDRSSYSIGFSDGKFWLKHLEHSSGSYSDVFSTMDAQGPAVFQEVSRLNSNLNSSPVQFFQMGAGTGYIEPSSSLSRHTHRATADEGGSWRDVRRDVWFPNSTPSSAAGGLGKIPVMCGRGMIVAAKPMVGLHLGSSAGPKPAARYVRIK